MFDTISLRHILLLTIDVLRLLDICHLRYNDAQQLEEAQRSNIVNKTVSFSLFDSMHRNIFYVKELTFINEGQHKN